MLEKRLKIILDTNNLISFLISKQFQRFDKLLFSSDIQLIFSQDPKDNFLLALAIDSDADFLVTGDQDLLSLKTIENTVIITLNQLDDKLH